MTAPISQPGRVLCTRKQVAEAWGISLGLVDKLVPSGQVPSVRLGRVRCIPAYVVYGIADTSRGEDNPVARVSTTPAVTQGMGKVQERQAASATTKSYGHEPRSPLQAVPKEWFQFDPRTMTSSTESNGWTSIWHRNTSLSTGI